MYFTQCHGDSAFGPAVLGCRGNFDFTLKFERIFLSLLPASAFIALALARIGFLIRRSTVVDNLTLMSLKLIGTTTYAALRLTLLVLSSRHFPQGLFIGSTSVEFICSLCILSLSWVEHSRSVRPSILLQLYLTFTLLFDITQTRTLWLASITSSEIAFTRLFTTVVVVKACIIILESRHKTKWVQWNAEKHSPEETIGIFGMSAYTWLSKTFYQGYTKILFIKDLSALDQRMATEDLQLKLLHHLSTTTSKQSFRIVRALTKTLKTSLLLPIPARLALTAFKFCQPFLIETLLHYLQQPAGTASKNDGYGLIGASVLIYTGLAVSTAIYWYFHERTLCMSRSALAGAIYRKSTEVKLSAAGDAAALTLMSTDVERIRLGFLNLHEFWANTLEVALSSWLLQRQVGNAFVAPLVVVLICISCAAFVNRYTGRRQRAWMSKIQKRVGLTANVISSMKHLKISGLAAPVEKLIQSMRVDELETASKFRTVQISVITFGYAPLALCPVITFAVTARNLDVSTIFTSLSFILLLADPLTYLFQNTPNLIAGFACLGRIQDFLTNESRTDYRLPDHDSSSANSSNDGLSYDKETSGPLIKIINGNFGWETGKLTLKNLNLDIPRSQLTMLVGPVASGKSTLCKVLLGEVPSSHGEIILNTGNNHKIGYCDQTPYLSNTTIKENIVGFSTFNQSRYNEVIEAAMLLQDIATLRDGDRTKAGSSGIKLSGGQKQRVSLARALYLDTEFFVFDDILSGLDADTEEQVFSRVFGPNGLLRRRNATVVLSTHSIQHLPSANHIIALGEDGTTIEQGSFQDLVANEKYVHGLDIKEATAELVESKLLAKVEDRPNVNEATVAEVAAPTYLDEKDRMLGDSTVYRYYLSSLGKTSVTAFTLFGLGWGFFYNFGTIWLRFWSDDVSSAHPSHTNAFYIGIYGLFQFCYLSCMFFSFLICFRTMIEVSGSKLHKAALVTVIAAPLKFFTTTDTGLVTNFFSQDMTLIDNELPMAITNLACDVSNALGMAAVIASSSAYLVISYPFIFVLLYGIQKFYLRTSRQLRLLDLEAKSPLYTHFLDTIKGVATFRAFGWVQPGIDLNNSLLDTSQRPTYLLAMVQRWLGFSLQVLVAILAVVVVTLATQLNSSTGLTGASLVTLMTFGDILKYIIRWYTQIETSIGAVSRLKNFSRKVVGEGLEGEDTVPGKEWPERGEVVLSGVSASYGEAEELEAGAAPSQLALKDLDIRILPGEKVAICGRSGSGKSSLILLLLSLLSPLPTCAQNITIDSLPLHKIHRPTLRERIIAIPQDPVFLPDGSSFMANLDPFNCSTKAEGQAVLESVGLWEMVKERGGLKGGLEAGSLSGGQRQLFSLARAVLRGRVRAREFQSQFGDVVGSENEKISEKGRVSVVVKVGGILLLDEVSSSVDQETDRLIQKVIMQEFKNYTVVMVSHRLEMVMGFDRVLVMDEGRVVESGKPKELIENEGGRFRDLCMLGGRS